MKRYHPLLVSLHWIMALMIFMALVVGGPMLADIPNSSPDKAGAMAGHMIWGLVVGVLLLARLITRFTTRKPPAADTGKPSLNLVAKAAHWALYAVVLAMVASGLTLAVNADLFQIAFQGAGTLPQELSIFSARLAHGFIANLLLTLILFHLVGWAYHQFVLKDALFSRMWYGRRRQQAEIAAE